MKSLGPQGVISTNSFTSVEEMSKNTLMAEAENKRSMDKNLSILSLFTSS